MKEENKTYTYVIQYIKDLVQSGEMKEGDRLPSERELSQVLNLSRNSIREALRTMDTLGLVESRHGSGNYLVGNIGKTLKETLMMMLLINKINYLDISQVRRAIERQAYKLVFDKVNEEQMIRLNKKVTALETATDREIINKDREFHHELVNISGNPIMIAIMEAMEDVFEEGILYNLKEMTEEERLKERNNHKEIVVGLQKQSFDFGLTGLEKHYDLIDKNLAGQ